MRSTGDVSDAPEQQVSPEALPPPEERLALLEAIIYVADEPLTAEQIAGGLELPLATVEQDLAQLIESYRPSSRGIEVRRLAGGYKMSTKAERHDGVRGFVKTLRPKLKLSLPALETLAVVAYKQPITMPEIQAIRGVNAGGVLHTLLKHKLVAHAGRKKVVGKPMMYKTTREFLVQFGLNDLSELPNLKELEELSRAALGDDAVEETAETDAPQQAQEAEAQEPEAEAPEAGEAEQTLEAEAAEAEAPEAETDEAEPSAETETAEPESDEAAVERPDER